MIINLPQQIKWLGSWAISFSSALRHPNRDIEAPMVKQLRDELSQTGTVPLDPLVVAYEPGLDDDLFDQVERAICDSLWRRWPILKRSTSPMGEFTAGARMIDDRRSLLCATLGLCHYCVETDRQSDCPDPVDFDFRSQITRPVGAMADVFPPLPPYAVETRGTAYG